MPNPTSVLIENLSKIPPDFLEVFLFLVLALSIVLFYRFFGKAGLYAYTAIAILIGNLQVLKAVQFSFYAYPIALGTTTFASLFCVSDILTENYGKHVALKGVWLGFFSALVTTLVMVMTLGMKPSHSLNPEASHFFLNHLALVRVFTPAPAILTASLIAYIMSQYADILIFQFIKNLTHQRWLWVRTTLSSFFSALLDTTVFSFCAWVLFAEHPVSTKTLLHTYILGGLTFRILASLAFTPLLYLTRSCIRKKKNETHHDTSF